MRTDSSHINEFRNRNHPQFKTEDSDGMTGYFVIPMEPDTWALVISSPGNETITWEHVSARIGYKKYHGKLAERVPTWDEMCLLKDIFWGDDEVVMQIHPKMEDYINQHPFVLHLWKPIGVEIPTPPRIAV
jgi:hypothetical protein